MAETHSLLFTSSLQVPHVRRIYRYALISAKTRAARIASPSQRVRSMAVWLVFLFVALGGEARAVPELAPDEKQNISGEAAAFESIDALLREVGNPQAQTAGGTPLGASSILLTNDSSGAGVQAPDAPDAVGSRNPSALPSVSSGDVAVGSSSLEPLQLAKSSADDRKTESTQSDLEPPALSSSSSGVTPGQGEKVPSGAVDGQNAQFASASSSEGKGMIAEILSGSKTEAKEFAKLMVAILGALLGVTLIAWQIMKSREGKDGSTTKSVRALQLSATLALGPKRQILLVRVRDTELALASTEHGISLLGEVGNSNRSAVASQLVASPVTVGSAVERAYAPAALPPPETTAVNADAPRNQMTGKKSEILRKALETIESRKKGDGSATESKAPAVSRSSSGAHESRQDSSSTGAGLSSEARNSPVHASRSTLPPGSEAQRFKKFFANSYKNQNTDRQEPRPTTQRAAVQSFDSVTTQNETENQTDNVAQLIREKLKQMRTIS